MNNQGKLNANDLKFVEKELSNYGLAYKIIPVFLLLMYFFMIWVSGEAFNSVFSIIFVVMLVLFYGLAYWLLQKQQKILEIDIQNGFKEIIMGVISDKISKKKSLIFKINKEKYIITNEHYMAFEENDKVKLEILPISKTVISIIKIEKNNE